MSDDAITRLLKLRIIRLGQELEADLRQKRGGNIAIEILHRLYDRQAESIGALPWCNVHDPKDRIKIQTLQNEVKRYDEWLGAMADIIRESHEYKAQIGAAEREDLIDYLCQTEEGTQHAIDLGLIDPAARDDA